MKFLFFLLLLLTERGHAFPEMIRHGYFNCTACHVSPSGGGVLSEYGRSLSKELLSTWGQEGEEKFLYALLPESESIRLGGDIRGIQTYLDNPAVRTGDFFWMQSDLEAALTIQKWILDVTAGTQGGPVATPKKDTFLSRRHFVGYKFTDEWTLRYGRFLTNFGWNQANHTMVTERNLGFDQGQEPYNTEASYLGEKWNAYFTHMNGRPDDATQDGERGIAISGSLSILEKNSIGISALDGKTNSGGHRQLAGIYGLIAIHEKVFFQFEYDHQWRQPNLATEQKGVVTYNRINYEAVRGLHLYGLHQIRYLDYHTPRNRMDAYGLGLQFFPRPHWELQFEFQKQRDLARFDSYYDYAWLMMHYYL